MPRSNPVQSTVRAGLVQYFKVFRLSFSRQNRQSMRPNHAKAGAEGSFMNQRPTESDLRGRIATQHHFFSHAVN